MLGKLIPGPILGVLTMLLVVINTLLWAVLLYLFAILKLLSPEGPARRTFGKAVEWVAGTWFDCNIAFVTLLIPTKWELEVPETLNKNNNYLITCNHQSWVDILALWSATRKDVPFFRFFLKEELKKVPVLGHAWMALDYPFMKRHSREEIAANPALAGTDIETTRKACEKYQGIPVTVVNFMEGTRFTAKKHEKQQSPYRHLLKPKSGGISFVLQAMGDKIHSLVNVTIIYPDGALELWPFLCGKVSRITVIVHEQPIPQEVISGDYANDPVFRSGFQQWVNGLWEEKDALITERLAQNQK